MRRTTRLGLAALSGLLLLTGGLVGCASDGPLTAIDPGERRSVAGPGTSSAAPFVPTEPYAATLTYVDGSLVLTNTGLGQDDYFLRITPSSAGQVSPAAVSLASGESVTVTVTPRKGAQVTVKAISGTLAKEIAAVAVLRTL
ncbi:hypothetical protein GCM10027020_24620 [Nocardioides salsibiostraticola]